MSEGVRKNKEEAVGVRRKIVSIEKMLENKPEGRMGPRRMTEVEGGIEKRKRNREGGKQPEVVGSRAGGEEMEFADLDPKYTQGNNLKT